MDERIKDKVIEIENYLEELESVLPNSYEGYNSDWKIRAICERNFEKIIGTTIDLGFLIVKKEAFESPSEEKRVFDVLSENEFISSELSQQLKDAKGMRNIIAHEYGKVDDELVFEAVKEQIIGVVREFIGCVGGLR